MAVATAWTRRDHLGKHRVVTKKITYDAGDTSIAINTGLKIIYAFDCSVPSVTLVPYDFATVDGGTITLTVTDPGAAAYIFMTAYGV